MENKFTLHDVERGLKELPAKIAEQAEIVEKARYEVDMAKHFLDVAKAKSIIRNNEHKESDKKALATVETQEQAVDLIGKEKDLAIAQVKLDQFTNYFIAIRKQAAFTLAEIESSKRDTIASNSDKGGYNE